MNRHLLTRPLAAVATLAALTLPARAADWPMWRFDAQRTASSPQQLAPSLRLQWVREYPPLRPAWPDQEKMQFDAAYEPVVVGQTLYVGSSRHDCVRALDTRSGREKWTCFVDGPVRFAPVVWEGNVYFSSDDGHLYCVDDETGRVLWKFRGGPGDRRILGNERLVSTWPARGAPVVADGTVYFGASIWPFMGIFIHALDARTGGLRWTNDGDGSLYIKQPHNADSFAGVAPQGPIAVNGDRLLLPGGRSIPACLDRRNGKLLRYQLAENGKRGGGSEVATLGDYFFNGGAVFDLATQKYLGDVGPHVVPTPDVVYAWNKGQLRALDFKSAGYRQETDDLVGKALKSKRWMMDELASLKLPGVEALIKAGSRLYAGTDGGVLAVDVGLAKKDMAVTWRAEVEGKVVRIIAADDRLFAVTREGKLYCFGPDAAEVARHAWPAAPQPPADVEAQRRVQQLLDVLPGTAGYAVVWGVGDGRLLRELVRQTRLHCVVIDPSTEKVQAGREAMTRDDLHGTRVCFLQGTPRTVSVPPYFASLVVCEEPSALGNDLDADSLAATFQSLRPFGGGAAFFNAPHLRSLLTPSPREKFAGLKVVPGEGVTVLVREGAPPGSANWTHEHADPANTRVSRDQLVKAPLGLLWFGGPSHDGILPRHGHGPQPQVVDGRLIIEGVDLLRAVDIYTGRLLWETKLPGVGFLYNNLAHQPGANAAGSNYVSTPDGIYVVYHHSCLRLDPATGKQLGEFKLPSFDGSGKPPRWGYLNVAGDYLIGGADPLFDPKLVPPPPKSPSDGDDKEPAEKKPAAKSSLTKLLKAFKHFNDNFSSSRHLVVMDRHSGKVLWTASAKNGFRHNATCAGGGRLYAIDRLSGDQLAKFKENDEEPPHPARVRTFDLTTGKELWSTDEGVFGTWLSYSEKRDVLVESGRVARDTLSDEPRGMRAYNAKDGAVLWFEKAYAGPAMIHGDTVLQGQGGCDLLTGALKMREDPITGEQVPWGWVRNYGCNTPAASEHLLTFRSGAAGYYDLCHDGGTGNFGGFRSSCTNNLVVAGGILTAPEYTRTCTCAYQNQTSLALVHMPEAEMWTFFGTKEVKGSLRRLGINFGAPGDRRGGNGTLWLEYPGVAGASPAVPITTRPKAPELFRRHPSAFPGPHGWIASSGARGLEEVRIKLNNEGHSGSYTVRLYFSEPDEIGPGRRRFDVELQGAVVLDDLDVAKEAGGPRRALVREFTGVKAADELVLRLVPSPAAEVRGTVLSGIEFEQEKGRSK